MAAVSAGAPATRSQIPDDSSAPVPSAQASSHGDAAQQPGAAEKQNPGQTQPAPQVNRDNGEEDTETEQILQEELETVTQQELAPFRPGIDLPLGKDEVMISGDNQEKNQDIYKVRGHVVIHFRDYVLHADEATYDTTTGHVTANGHVVFDGGAHNEHLTGSRATYDISRDIGTFYDVKGSTGIRVKNKTIFLTSSTPFFFTGKVVDKLGPDRYRVHHGTITSCQLPRPKWDFQSSTTNVELGEDAHMHHATLRIRGIPIFYFPYMQHPVDNLGRKTGFLLPVIGQSNSRGTILGDGFYWAINKSMDATMGASLYSSRGWAEEGEFRAVGYKYVFHAQYFGVNDNKGYPGNPSLKEGGREFKANGEVNLPWGFRGVVSVDYLSSYLFRLAFAQGYMGANSSEARSSGFVSKNWDGYAVGVQVSRYQNYESLTPGDVIDIAHTPSFEFSTLERPLFNSSVLYGYDFAVEGVSRHEPGFETGTEVGRVDAYPHFSLPAFLHGWTFRPEVGVRDTYYTERLRPAQGPSIGTAMNEAINRRALLGSMEVRPPALSKIFDHKPFGYVWKHTVEPRVVYNYVTGVNSFDQILRFDERDILADTSEVEYGIVNRLYAKKSSSSGNCFQHPKYLAPDDTRLAGITSENSLAAERKRLEREGYCDDHLGPAREMITWQLGQKYFMNQNFGGALENGQRNVFDTTEELTGIAFLTAPRRFSPIVSRLRFQSGNFDVQWNLDYDTKLGQINSSMGLFYYRIGNWNLNGGTTYLHIPGATVLSSTGVPEPSVFNQYHMGFGYGNLSKKGFNGAFSMGYDSQTGYLMSTVVQTTYNWDCCGVTFEYLRWNAPGATSEKMYRFGLTLSNIGTFGNLKQTQRIY